MTRILGYANEISVAPGDRLDVMVSCDGLDQYDATLVRVIQGDINPDGPGYREQVIALDLGGPFEGRYQAIHAGSYGLVNDAPPWSTDKSLGIQALIWPTLPGAHRQTILSHEDPDTESGFRLLLDDKGALAFEILAHGETLGRLSTSQPLVSHRWYVASASYEAKNGVMSVCQHPLLPEPQSGQTATVSTSTAKPDAAAVVAAPIMLAARPTRDLPSAEHFNGRIEAPRLLNRSLSKLEQLASLEPTSEGMIAAWDFSLDISSDRITDCSGNNLDGTLFNLPTRAVAGHAWNGEEHNWRRKPAHYAAIHFHDDDLYDCGWETDFTIELPEDIASGVYAVRLESGDDAQSTEYYIPFAVRPLRGTTTAPVAFILPTASYLAYANNRIGIDVPETEIVCGALLQLNADDLFLQTHPEPGLSFYDLHNDGSGVYYSSRLRPIINLQPKQIGHLGGSGSNVWQFNADTHILDWLENLGQPFDVITDEDLEREGAALLSGYSALITGTHPEYYSAGMLDSIQSYLDGSGRLMYMGGNGFYWRVSFHPTLPGVIECRKSEDGIRAFPPPPGEFYGSFTGEYTGLWRRNGRAPNTLVGIGMVSQGFDHSAPYRLTEASRNPRVAFIFEGVTGPVIGDYGLSGGGAAGLELDATDHALGTPVHTLVLATSEKHSDVYLMTPEDMNDPAPGIGGSEAEIIRAEMTFMETPGGGAVFSTGSIAWSGSLSHQEYGNDIARISANVLRRFLDDTLFEFESKLE